jgi:glycosyltransferase involved in cell wall biosynthesis
MKGKNSLDVIIASCPPLFSAMAAIRASRKLGAKSIIDIQDLWPETFETVFPYKIAKAFFYPLKMYADNIYNSADALMTVSRTYADRALSMRNCSRPSLVVHLGVDLKLFDKYTESNSPVKKRDNEFWATYVGTIGKSYDTKTILNVAELLKASYTNIRFFIAGDGPQLTEMKNIAEKKKLTNCKFLGFLKFEDMVGLLRQSDIGLNTFAKNTKNAFPNKVFDYMATGLPIINSIQSELEELLKSEKVGIQYEAENAVSLEDAILELYDNPERRRQMGENARRLVEERFDKNKEYPKIEEFLREVVKHE